MGIRDEGGARVTRLLFLSLSIADPESSCTGCPLTPSPRRRKNYHGWATPAISPLHHVAFTAMAAVAVAGRNYRGCSYKNKVVDWEVSQRLGAVKELTIPATLR